MYLKPKAQTDLISRIKERFDPWRNHWDARFNKYFKRDREMAKGELPSEIITRLKSDPDYAYKAKLVPRVIPDSIQYMKAIASNSLFNRDLMFEFVGLRGEDPAIAQNGYDLVSYEFWINQMRRICDQVLEDALEVGIGFLERFHHRDLRLSPTYGLDEQGNKILIRDNYELIYEGPSARRLMPEMVYLNPDITDPMIRPDYTKLMVLPISDFQLGALGNGIYSEYADNIKKIKPGDYDPAIATDKNRSGDHQTGQANVYKETDDFPVLYAESWWRMRIPGVTIPVLCCIGINNIFTRPQLVRYDIDPMLTGQSPLEICRVYPKNDQIAGESLPNRLYGYFLEKYFKRNQRIDLVNLARDVTGIIFADGQLKDLDSMVTRRKRIITTTTGMAANFKHIQLDTSPIPHLMNEEALIDQDIEKTNASNRISMGQSAMRRETATALSIVNENSQIMSNYPLRQIEDTLIRPTALAFLIHSQLLMPERFKTRVLGPNAWIFKDMNRGDILGVFDVVCYASSEILTKGVKQALMDKFVQTWSGNPNVRADWQGIMREHLKISEVPLAARYVPETSFDQAYAERENKLIMNGAIVDVIEQDNHVIHIPIHEKLLEFTGQLLKVAGIRGLGQEGAAEMASNVEIHIGLHKQMFAQAQGQVQGPNMPIVENRQKLLRNINSDMQTGVMSD